MRFGKSFAKFKTKLDVSSLFDAHFPTDNKNTVTLGAITPVLYIHISWNVSRMSMKDKPFKRAYLQIFTGGATGWAPFEKVWELLKHTLYVIRDSPYIW